MDYFIDIDGTLTDTPTDTWGNPHKSRIERVRQMIEGGDVVVLWSGGGAAYAQDWADRFHLPCVCLAKPDVIIDDNPVIRPILTSSSGVLVVRPPNFLD